MSAPGAWAGAAAVAGGAALGALCRWGAGIWLNARWQGFPLGTLFVNLVGGLLIGLALVWLEARSHDALRLFVMRGVLGGCRTFSAFSAESLAEIRSARAWYEGRSPEAAGRFVDAIEEAVQRIAT